MLFIMFVYFILFINRYNNICKPFMFVLPDKNTHNRLVIYMCIRYYGTVTNEYTGIITYVNPLCLYFLIRTHITVLLYTCVLGTMVL